MDSTRIHRHSTGSQGALVNAYLVETPDGVVAVDGTLTVSDGRALRSRLDELGQPLLAVLVTHADPDHYGGFPQTSDAGGAPLRAACRRS
ncbi:MAG: MBL fold metallo-hydrolase [Gaiellaceae bacterium]